MARILVVDDEVELLDSLAGLLAMRGHEVRTASSGLAAVDMGQVFTPDILIVDRLLKDEVEGLEVISALQPTCTNMQTILISGYPCTDIKDEMERRGILEFLQKPFDIQGLLGAVQRAEQELGL